MRFKLCNLKSYLSRIHSQPTTGKNSLTISLQLREPYSLLQHCPNQYAIPRRWHLGHSQSQDGHHHQDLQLTGGKEAENFSGWVWRPMSAYPLAKQLLGIYLEAQLSLPTLLIPRLMWFLVALLCGRLKLQRFLKTKIIHMVASAFSYTFSLSCDAFICLEGHGKFEILGALGISCMLLATAGGIAWHAVDLLLGILSSGPEIVNHSFAHEHVNDHSHGGHHHGMDMDYPILAFSMAIISISNKEGLYWITKRAGEKQGSGLMKASAWHHRADVISSFCALIGIGGSLLGVKFLDPLAGLVVSGMILKAGIETGYQSVLELVDAAIPAEHLEPIRETVLQVEGVKGCHHLRGRRAGSSLYLDVHIEVNPFLSVSAGHGLGEAVRHQIHNSHPQVTEVFIHIDPSTSEFCSSSVEDQQELLEDDCIRNSVTSMNHKEIEDIVLNSFSSKYGEEIAVERITQHLLQGKILLDVEVSIQPNMLIREAMELAKEAEEEMMKVVPRNFHVRFQLRLGRGTVKNMDDEINNKP